MEVVKFHLKKKVNIKPPKHEIKRVTKRDKKKKGKTLSREYHTKCKKTANCVTKKNKKGCVGGGKRKRLENAAKYKKKAVAAKRGRGDKNPKKTGAKRNQKRLKTGDPGCERRKKKKKKRSELDGKKRGEIKKEQGKKREIIKLGVRRKRKVKPEGNGGEIKYTRKKKGPPETKKKMGGM